MVDGGSNWTSGCSDVRVVELAVVPMRVTLECFARARFVAFLGIAAGIVVAGIGVFGIDWSLSLSLSLSRSLSLFKLPSRWLSLLRVSMVGNANCGESGNGHDNGNAQDDDGGVCVVMATSGIDISVCFFWK